MNSKVLVGVQFSMIFLIIMVGTFPATIFTIVILAGGLLLGSAAILTMRFDNLRIFPEPKKDIRLVTTGPYRILRHPMYTSVLLITASFVAEVPTLLLCAFWLILLSALMGKVQIEEKLLPQHLPDYTEYQKRTWKLIPFIF
jgi:protein-S-isoprenylcysteine O-methyltransferase Ste14